MVLLNATLLAGPVAADQDACANASATVLACLVQSDSLTALSITPPCTAAATGVLQDSSQGESSHLGKRPAPGQSIAAGPKRSKLT